MSPSTFDALLARMPEISAAVEKFSSEAIQARVLEALLAAFDGENRLGHKAASQSDLHDDEGTALPFSKSSITKTPRVKKTTGGKGKHPNAIDKDLDLVNGADQPFSTFVDWKQPTSQEEKCLVAVYWLTRVLIEKTPATVDRVYTCFKHMGWPVPANLANAIQRAGTKGWLDSRNRDDLKVVIGGENYLEHKMPAKKKAGAQQ